MRATLLGLLAVTLSAACAGEPFDPKWRLEEPRILAVRAEPPMIPVDGEVSLEALLVDGQGRAMADEVSWRACNPWNYVLDPDKDCGPAVALPFDRVLSFAEVLAAFPPPDGLVPPGVGGVTFDPCADGPTFGLPVIAEVVIDGRRLLARKEVPVALREGDLFRRNPVLAGLRLDGRQVDGFRPGAVYELGVSIGEDSLDEVCVDGERSLEDVRVHLYVNAGELADSAIDIEYFPDGSRAEQLTEWTAPSQGEASFWLVAADADGGTDWLPVALRDRAP